MRKADNLRELRMNINNWAHIRMESLEKTAVEKSVRNMMLREGSVLRVVGMGSTVYRVRLISPTLCARRRVLTHSFRANGCVARRRMGQTSSTSRSYRTLYRIGGTRLRLRILGFWICVCSFGLSLWLSDWLYISIGLRRRHVV